MCVCVCVCVNCSVMSDCNPLGSSVHGILQARILEWIGIPFSRGSSQPRDWTQVTCTADGAKREAWIPPYSSLIHRHLFRLKLKKLGKATRPLRYNLNQIPYNYTVEVTNRLKGLNLTERAWRTMDGGLWHCTGDRDQDHPQEKEMQKSKMAVWGLTNSCEKKRSERQRRKGKIYPFECRVPKNSKER